jgi:hypothetical protein
MNIWGNGFSYIGGDLNLPYADCKGNVDITSRGQTFINLEKWVHSGS